MVNQAGFPPFPKFDVDALMAIQKANYETFAQVQKIVTDAVESAWQAHLKRVDGWKSQAQTAYKSFDPTKKPEAYVKDAQIAVETAIAEAKDTVENTVKTQREVAQVLADRMVANFNQLKSLAS
jgi:hypothetical protein